jgi:putative transposase
MLDQQIALFRFQFIAPLTHLPAGEKESYIQKIAGREVTAPNGRLYCLSRATLFRWLKKYQQNGMEGLKPPTRIDQGVSKKIPDEVAQALIRLKQEKPKLTLDSLIHQARVKNIIPKGGHLARVTLYRLLKRHGLFNQDTTPKVDRRRFEAEAPMDLVQSDAMHGPKVAGKKTYLIAFLDDHSRLILHAEFKDADSEENLIAALKIALNKRGLPRKLYVDNGPSFRSKRMAYALAVMGVALIHARPYQPQGKGKCERWFKTIRQSFLPGLALTDLESLTTLNEALWKWIDGYYHQKTHSSTGQAPLERFIQHLQATRKAPASMETLFRFRALRKVNKDRSVSLHGKAYEAPIGSIGKKIELAYDPENLEKVEAFDEGKSLGELKPILVHSNAKIKRTKNHELDLDTGSYRDRPPSGKVPFYKKYQS